MKVGNFKYKLGEKVMVVGRQGLCVITGRGSMEFCSGGKLNIYQIGGAHGDSLQEDLLWTPEEVYKFCSENK